ncbi:MAG TPA: terminase family protein [Steroidobacteraceae bacterium]|nr:terminase family protein [Steroidobacteraceae bacterium]
MADSGRSQFFGTLAQSLRGADAYDWSLIARPNQLPPIWAWFIWLLLAGRGFGKTRSELEFCRTEVEAGRAGRVALVAATAADARDVLVEGPSGILTISPDYNRPVYEPSKRRLTWPNGAVATTFSADEADRLRGPQHDLAVCDELAAWRYPEAWDMLMMGLRMGKNPRCVVATTPRPGKLLRSLLAREGKDVAVTRGATFDNAANLAPQFLDTIITRYQGTRLGRQELNGEMLADTPGALWSLSNLDETRVVAAPLLKRIVVAIDPAGSTAEGSDETGIVTAGLGINDHGYVLGDLSGRYAPAEWARRALNIFHALGADRIVIEKNFGGDMAAATLRSIEPLIPITEVTSSRGKILRAEPVSALFEQRRAHVVGSLPDLETQMASFTSDWSRERDGSPDRVDAMVFALTELMLNAKVGTYAHTSVSMGGSRRR